MASLKVVLFYQQAARGWTETYYATGTSPQTWAQANINNSTMAPFVQMRANDVFLSEVRVSQIGSPRVTYSVPFYLASSNAYGADADDWVQDTYGEDALLLVRSGAGVPRHIWLRGLPNILIVYSPTGIPQPPGTLISYIGQLQSQILQLGLYINNVSVPIPTSASWAPVQSVAAAPTVGTPMAVLTTINQPLGVTAGSQVYFQGVPRELLHGFPRIATVSAIIQNGTVWDTYVSYLYRGATSVTYPPKMKFTSLVYVPNAITSLAFETYGTRKTGRPTGLPRGRAPAVIRRQ